MLQQEKYGGEKSLNMAFMRVLPNAIRLYKKCPQYQNNAGNHDQQSHALKPHQGALAKKTPRKTPPCQPDQQKRKRLPQNISPNTQKQPALTTTRTDSSLPLTEKELQKHQDREANHRSIGKKMKPTAQHFKRIHAGGAFYIKSLTHPHQHPLSSKEKIDARAELSV
ncbi:hypothetical protein [Bartonella sp. ML69XJBT]|uniref:hypothetical protein n=1 Tax=Bartonella sp. ML69XJBT TaxID=3019092 RepID=UPI00235FE2AC|nr:hypothetical protein [Bartonella sp. ML69XJBT]